MKSRRENLMTALQAEIAALEKKEKKLSAAALKTKQPQWKAEIEKRIPSKVYEGIESAFSKGFGLVFEQGRSLIEKSYDKENLVADHSIRDFALNVKGGRRQLRQMKNSAARTDFINLAVTTLEGVGLGALGIGLPDIVLFISTILKGVYETALNFGFDYMTGYERLLILKMLEASLSTGEAWEKASIEIDSLFREGEREVTKEEIDQQIRSTASVFAMDMLVLKFIQGVPVVGLFAGAANPVYYKKILGYVQLKYRKHYMIKKLYECKGLMRI